MTMTTDAGAMRAWTQNAYGGPETVGLGRVPVPEPRAGDVIVRVRATALASGDVRVMRGEPLLVRAAFGVRRPRVGPGRDVAGVVVAVGADVDGVGIGDEVVGESGGGGLAEYVRVPAKVLARRPESVDAVTAAALPLAGGTAWQALERGGLPGDAAGARVLVVGAGGGVGMYAVELAAGRGAEVTALASSRAHEQLRARGPAVVHDYRETPVDSLPAASFDLVLVMGGPVHLRQLRRVVVDGGRIVLVSGGENRVVGPMVTLAAASLTSIGSRRKAVGLLAMPDAAVTARLLELVARGRLTPHLDLVAPFSRARDALARVDGGGVVGKVVVRAAVDDF